MSLLVTIAAIVVVVTMLSTIVNLTQSMDGDQSRQSNTSVDPPRGF